MTYENQLLEKKQKVEDLLALKFTARDCAVKAMQGESKPFSDFLQRDINEYDIEIEALQSFIEAIELELKDKTI